ncbi:ubiquitin carboxyl-terminal hydrolase isoform X1 [Frankliniella occidentalis]|uniref:Ubiquitin carboxyl-terminal hydrolase n=1 Tax=Frankliniella occidentalis TaxID=133901 RepID=A0A6J1T4V5_FRAOC|nr:ubiquitin carboxyl-terminal hydrolase isoform X1 [Frankliniella occidentalis]
MAWQPLESNPEVMTKYIQRAGVSDDIQVVDVFGLDPDILAIVPQPTYSLILLFPCSDIYEKFKADEEEMLKDKDQKIPSSTFFMKQITPNACGTIALVHGILNNLDEIKLKDGILKDFIEKAASLSPLERGDLLDKMGSIIDLHKEVAAEGQTEAPPAEEKIIHHFVAFVHKEGNLLELDGRKFGPINHGPTTPETFLADAAKVCKTFMTRDPEEVRFTIVAISRDQN